MKKLIYLFGIFIYTLNCPSQNVFQKTFGGVNNDFGQSVQQTIDEGFVLPGSSEFGTGNYDFYLIKSDSNGSLLWSKTYGGNNLDYCHEVRQSLDGGFILVGYTNSFGAGDNDFLLIKTDSLGNTIWTKTYGGSNSEIGYSVKPTLDGGFIVVGNTYSFGAGGTDIYLIRVDSNGDSIWAKTYGTNFQEDGYFVNLTYDGGYIITGGSGGHICLMNVDSTGNLIWSKNYSTTSICYANSVQQTTDGGFIITGAKGDFMVNAMDFYALKTDSIGNVIWSKTFGGANNDAGINAHQTTDGGFILSGFTGSLGAGFNDAYLIKTDFNGNPIWEKTYGGVGNDNAISVQQTTDGGYVLAGWCQSFGAGYYDFNFIKTDSWGNSGCNEGVALTILSPPTTQTLNPLTIVGSTPIVITNPMINVSSGVMSTTLCKSVSLSHILNTQPNITVSPNPFSSFIEITGTADGEISLIDVTGKVILYQKTSHETTEIKIENVSPGIYLLQYSENGTSKNFKLVKQ